MRAWHLLAVALFIGLQCIGFAQENRIKVRSISVTPILDWKDPLALTIPKIQAIYDSDPTLPPPAKPNTTDFGGIALSLQTKTVEPNAAEAAATPPMTSVTRPRM